MVSTAKDKLASRLISHLQSARPEAAARLEEGLAAFAERPTRELFFRLFALVPRWSGKTDAADLALDASALAEVAPGLAKAPWHFDDLARLLILRYAQDVWPEEQFARELDTLFNAADTGELVDLYRCLTFLDDPDQFTARAREGARSNIIPVFLAVAHHNDFPSLYFDEQGWNQLVLKAVFNACSLADIPGLEVRNNPRLSHMLADYVRERWAAGREVPWDIWRCIGPHAEETGDVDLLAQALESDDNMTRLAAAVAAREASIARGELLTRHPDICKAVADLGWHDLAALVEGD